MAPFLVIHISVIVPVNGRVPSLSRVSGLLFLMFTTCVLILAGGQAQAQTPSPIAEWQYSSGIELQKRFEPDHPASNWRGTVGASVATQPSYLGSDHYDITGGPNFDIRYKDVAFLSTGEGLGVNLLFTDHFRLGAALGYDLGRHEDDDRRLRGMGNISSAVVPRLFAAMVLFPVTFRLDIRKGIGGNKGIIGDASVYAPVYGSKQFVLFVGGSATFASAQYNTRYFGVNANQSASSGYRTYDPDAGPVAVSFGSSAIWFFSPRRTWFADATLTLDRLLGDAAHSPLAAARYSSAVALSIGYQFGDGL
jgi:outer membrane scaffolding protein for murein synthesis (MipA/OmpV family)